MPNTHNAFKQAKDAVKAYLDQRASADPQFSLAYAKENKNIDECFRYILGEAHKLGASVCMTDEEVFGLAVHYYDEDDIVVAKAPARSSSVARTASNVQLTEEEKSQIRERAKQRYEQECLKEEARKADERRAKESEKKRAKNTVKEPYSPPLFDF